MGLYLWGMMQSSRRIVQTLWNRRRVHLPHAALSTAPGTRPPTRLFPHQTPTTATAPCCVGSYGSVIALRTPFMSKLRTRGENTLYFRGDDRHGVSRLGILIHIDSADVSEPHCSISLYGSAGTLNRNDSNMKSIEMSGEGKKKITLRCRTPSSGGGSRA